MYLRDKPKQLGMWSVSVAEGQDRLMLFCYCFHFDSKLKSVCPFQCSSAAFSALAAPGQSRVEIDAYHSIGMHRVWGTGGRVCFCPQMLCGTCIRHLLITRCSAYPGGQLDRSFSGSTPTAARFCSRLVLQQGEWLCQLVDFFVRRYHAGLYS